MLVTLLFPVFAAASTVCNLLDQDLSYIHNSMKQNLAAYQFDAGLRSRADAAFVQQKAKISECESDQDYLRVIRGYLAAYHDPHLQPWWTIRASIVPIVTASLGHEIMPLQAKTHYAATGIGMQRLGNAYFVKAIDPERSLAVQAHDELVSCEGKTPAEILQTEVLPFEGVSSEAASTYLFADHLFFRWDKEPGAKSACIFRHEGIEKAVELEWFAVDESYLKRFSTNDPNKPIYSIENRPYGHWIRLSSFAGYGPEQNRQLAQFVEDAKSLKGDSIVVLDLRGNSGGNSSWGNKWIQNLYGYQPQVSDKLNFVFSSPGNIGHYERVFQLLSNSGGFPSNADRESAQQMIDLMKANPGQLVSLGGGESPLQKAAPQPEFVGKLYVISDAGVFSSGELFLQTLRLLPGVTQVGMATNASTLAGDIRFDQTPGGLVFSLGTKVFQNIFVSREPGEPLLPQIEILQNPALEFQGKDSVALKLEDILAAQSTN